MSAPRAKRARTEATPGADGRYSKAQWKRFNSRIGYVERKGFPPNQFYKRFYPRNDESLARYGSSRKTATEEQLRARTADMMMGRGKYGFKTAGRLVRSVARNKAVRSYAKNALVGAASTYNPAAGAALGSLLGNGMYAGAARSLGGSGAYEMMDADMGAPISNLSDVVHGGQLFKAPHFSAGGDGHDSGGLVISNQEYVQTVYGNPSGVNFVSTTYNVNPGLAEVFPMLSQFAGNFENYELIQCAFHFETLLDEGVFQSSTGQVGDILMYSHINPDQTELQNVSEFIQAGGHISRATKGAISGVECDPDQLRGLDNAGINRVRVYPIASDEDASDYDQAKFQFAVSNTPSTLVDQPIGRLYVSYTVRLIKPRLHTLLARNQLSDVFYGKSTTAYTPTTGEVYPILAAALGGTLGEMTKYSKNNIGCALSYSISASEEALTITLPSWLQGLIKITVKSLVSGDPDTTAELHSSMAISGAVLTGNVTGYTGNRGFYGLGDVGDYDTNNMRAISGARAFFRWEKHFRVSMPDDEQNTITIKNTQTATASMTDMLSMESFVFVEVVQDFSAVGSQLMTDVGDMISL